MLTYTINTVRSLVLTFIANTVRSLVLTFIANIVRSLVLAHKPTSLSQARPSESHTHPPGVLGGCSQSLTNNGQCPPSTRVSASTLTLVTWTSTSCWVQPVIFSGAAPITPCTSTIASRYRLEDKCDKDSIR